MKVHHKYLVRYISVFLAVHLLGYVYFLPNANASLDELQRFIPPEVGKYRVCTLNVNCSQSRDCTPKRSCYQKECQSIYSLSKCRKTLLGGIKFTDPACQVEREHRKLLCETQRASKKAACEAQREAERLDCERIRSVNRIQCESAAQAVFSKCNQIKQEEISSGEGNLKIIEKSLETLGEVTKKSIPPDVSNRLRDYFTGDILDNIGLAFSKDYEKWYSFIYSKKDYVDWKDVSGLPVLKEVNVLVVGNNIIFGPEENLENISLDALVRSIVHVSLYRDLGNEGFAQIYSNRRDMLFDYVDSKTDEICKMLNCY